MKEEEKKLVYQYLKKYINQQQEHSTYIDYYELFNLDESMTIEQLQGEIKKKKLIKLFHPDQESILDMDFQAVFRECSSNIQEMKNIFSSERLKSNYDNDLKQQKKPKESISSIKEEKDASSFTIEEKNNLERAMETTIYKHGFYHGYMALQKAVHNNDFSSFTSDNNSRELLRQIGYKKIRGIIQSYQEDLMETESNNIVMNYYCGIINKSGLKEKADVFYDACLQTALKYDVDSDRYQTDYAISYYIEDLNMDSFTNQNVDKQELAKLSPQDVQLLINVRMHSLSKENPDYLFSNFSQKTKGEQIRLFSKEIKKEAASIKQQRNTI